MDYSPPGSSVHGILQARILEWGSSQPRDQINIIYVSCIAGGFFTTSTLFLGCSLKTRTSSLKKTMDWHLTQLEMEIHLTDTSQSAESHFL